MSLRLILIRQPKPGEESTRWMNDSVPVSALRLRGGKADMGKNWGKGALGGYLNIVLSNIPIYYWGLNFFISLLITLADGWCTMKRSGVTMTADVTTNQLLCDTECSDSPPQAMTLSTVASYPTFHRPLIQCPTIYYYYSTSDITPLTQQPPASVIRRHPLSNTY